MRISESRQNNIFAITEVENWLDLPAGTLKHYYEELISQKKFLAELSLQIEKHKNFKNNIPGLFKQIPIKNVDWYGLQRILLYCLVRHMKPKLVVETGVYYGGNSVFILAALEENKKGKLFSIDYPQVLMNSQAKSKRHPWVGDSEVYEKIYQPGFIIPEILRTRFNLIVGDSLKEIPKLTGKIDLFIHDSEHTFKHVQSELNLIWKNLSNNALAYIDDIDWSNGFYSFVVENYLYPLLLTDNGKDNLRVRNGLIKKNHKFNNVKYLTRK